MSEEIKTVETIEADPTVGQVIVEGSASGVSEGLAVVEDEVDAGGLLEVLDPSGHFEVRWGSKKSEVEIAEATFKDLLSKGYLAFKKTWTGRKGRRMESFDSEAGVAVFDKAVDAKKLPVRDLAAEAKAAEEKARRDAEAAEEKAKQDAEEAAKKERVKAAKRARSLAVEKARSAKGEHEEATRKLREAREQEGTAGRELDDLAAKIQAAIGRREEALKALGTTEGEAKDVAAKEHEAALAAEAETKKAHEEKAPQAVDARRARDLALAAETEAHDRKRAAEKAVAEAEAEHDDAMTDLHGEPTYEQTKELDRRARTVATPPMRGG